MEPLGSLHGHGSILSRRLRRRDFGNLPQGEREFPSTNGIGEFRTPLRQLSHDSRGCIRRDAGKQTAVADPLEKAKDVAEAVTHPIETTKELAEEAERGRSARTPVIALTGVTLIVGAIAGLLIAIGLVVYFVSR
jgi:hypothetical protein